MTFALTIHQPWATLIAIGAKCVETRDWPPPANLLGEEILIHAGKHPAGGSTKAAEVSFRRECEEEPFLSALLAAGYSNPGEMPRGAVIATARIKRASRMTPESILALEQRNPTERAFGFYDVGRYAWVLDQIRRLEEPVPARGMQKLWRPKVEVVQAVESQRWSGTLA